MPDDWATYCPKTRPSAAKLTVAMNFAVTPEMAEDIRRCVMRRRESLSAWMRVAAAALIDCDDAEFDEEHED